MFKVNILTCVMSILLIFIVPQSFFACKTFDAVDEKSVLGLFPNEQHTVDIFDRTSSSVVFIKNKRQHPTMGEITYCCGSGYVVSHGGHKVIVTNYHVVEFAYSVWVTIGNKEWEAEFIGGSPARDIAVIGIKYTPNIALGKVDPITLGQSKDLKVGQDVYVLGHPFGLQLSMTKGIISGLNRKIRTRDGTYVNGCIQVDSAVNPGNSGGVLLNSRGELIGMPSMIISRGGDFCGVAFAIPVDLIKETIATIMDTHTKMVRFFDKFLDYSK